MRQKIRRAAARCLGAWALAVLVTFFCPGAAGAQDPGLIIYPAPSGAIENAQFTVQIRKEGGTWQEIFVYDEEVNPGYEQHTGYVYFDSDFSKRLELKVTNHLHSRITSARIRPWSYNIAFTQEDSGRTVRFFLDRPRKVVVEFNKDVFHNLQVFANPLEVNPPQPGEAGVKYYGPGVHSIGGNLGLASGQTIYIAGGAIVRGNISASGVDNVTVRGRGVLDGSIFAGRSSPPRMISISDAGGIHIEGIIITHSYRWTIVPTASDRVTITNVKEICRLGWGDGIDLVSCQEVTIDDVYLRNGDDNISIKARGSEPNRNIVIKNSVFFCDNAHPILIGPEGNGTYTEKVTFINNDILQATMGGAYGGALAICAGDNMTIRDVTFQDVRIDTFSLSASMVANVFIEDNVYTSSPGRSISNVTYKDITCHLKRWEPIRIAGYDASRKVDGVTFDNVSINGVPVGDTVATAFNVNEFAVNIIFKPGETGIRAPAMVTEGLKTGLWQPKGWYDLLGRRVLTNPAGLRNLAPGVYLVRQADGNALHQAAIIH